MAKTPETPKEARGNNGEAFIEAVEAELALLAEADEHYRQSSMFLDACPKHWLCARKQET